jgi:hypothetical protein
MNPDGQNYWTAFEFLLAWCQGTEVPRNRNDVQHMF